MNEGMICVVYVDDTIFAGSSGEVLEAEIANLGIYSERNFHSFQFEMKERLKLSGNYS